MELSEVSKKMTALAKLHEETMSEMSGLSRKALKAVRAELDGEFTTSAPERGSVAFRSGSDRVVVRRLFMEGLLGVSRQRERRSTQRRKSWGDCEREMQIPAADVPKRVRFWLTASPDEIEADWHKRHKYERRTVLDFWRKK